MHFSRISGSGLQKQILRCFAQNKKIYEKGVPLRESFISLWRKYANYHIFNSENLFEGVLLKSWEIGTKEDGFVPKWGKYKRDGINTQPLAFLTWELRNKRSENII